MVIAGLVFSLSGIALAKDGNLHKRFKDDPEITVYLDEIIVEADDAEVEKEIFREVFKNASAKRALTIARTETSRAVNFATQQAYLQNGIEKKQWLTNFDERTCEYCFPLNGTIIKTGSNYFVKGDEYEGNKGGILKIDYDRVSHPPLHSKCRCTLIPIVE